VYLPALRSYLPPGMTARWKMSLSRVPLLFCWMPGRSELAMSLKEGSRVAYEAAFWKGTLLLARLVTQSR